MTTPIRPEPAPAATPAWITWPIRAVALLVVLPFRLLWELGGLVNRFVLVPVGRAIGWLLRTFLLAPLLWLLRQLLQWILLPIWHALRWMVAALVAGIAWTLRMLLRFLLRPIGLALAAVLVLLGRWVVMPFYNWVLAPIGRGLAWLLLAAYRWILTPAGRGIAWAWGASYRWILLPIGRAVAGTARAFHRYLLRPVGVAIAVTWRYTFGAAGRWVRDEVLRPTGDVVRAALGLRR